MAVTPTPTLDEFIQEVKPLNPDATPEQLTQAYQARFPTPVSSMPTLDDFVKEVKPLNPDASDDQLKAAWQERFPGARESSPGFGENVMRGAEVGMKQFVPTLKGAVGLLGATAEEAVGEGGIATAVKNWGLTGFKEGMEKIQPLQQENDEMTTVWKKVTEDGDVGALKDFVAYGLGYGASQLAQSLAVGVAGMAIGGPVGAISGIVEQTAAKGLIASWVEKAVVKRMAQGMTKDAAVRSIGRDMGALTGMGAFATSQEMGQIYPEAEKHATETGEPLGATDIARIWGASAVAGASELIPEAYIFGKALGRFTGGPSRLGRTAVAGTTGAALEGGQEAFQTGVEHYGAGEPVADEAGLKDIINSAALAMVGGGSAGATAGFISPKPKSPIAPIIEAKSVDETIEKFKQVVTEPTVTGENLDTFIHGATLEGTTQALHTEWKGQKDADQKLLEQVFTDYEPEVGEPDPFTSDERGNTFFNGSPLEALHPKELPLSTGPNEGLSQQKFDVLNSIASLFGKNVVVFRTGESLPDGLVHFAKAPSTIFLSSKTQDADLFSVFSHEAVHMMQGTTFHQALIDTVWGMKSPEWKQLAITRHGDLPHAELMNEVVADIAGTELHKPEVWEKVYKTLQERVGEDQAKQETLTFIDTLKGLIQKVKDLIASKPWSTGFGVNKKTLAEQYVTDLTKVHDALAEGVANVLYEARPKTTQQTANEQMKLALSKRSKNPEPREIVHPEAVLAFTELAHQQRGKPESAMLRVQKAIGGGVLNPVVEHVGDLTHRLTEMAGHGLAGQPYVQEKVNRALSMLTHAYGFEKEHHENLRNNARYFNQPVDEVRKAVDAALVDYTTEHRKLPTYNLPQWLANQAAIAVGEKRFDDAAALLKELKAIADLKPAEFNKLSLSFTREKGKIAKYARPLPAKLIGKQESGNPLIPAFELYNLEQALPGHPVGSTVSRETIEKAGYRPQPTDLVTKSDLAKEKEVRIEKFNPKEETGEKNAPTKLWRVLVGDEIVDSASTKAAAEHLADLARQHLKQEVQTNGEKTQPDTEGKAQEEYDYASTQIDLAPALAQKVLALGQQIKTEDLAEKGREDDPHITVLYGLHSENPKQAAVLLEAEKPVTATIGDLDLFETEDADVVMLHVDSPDLEAINKKLEGALENTKEKEYHPHITVAFVKPGLGKGYVESLRNTLKGNLIKADTITFSDKKGEKTPIKLGEQKKLALAQQKKLVIVNIGLNVNDGSTITANQARAELKKAGVKIVSSSEQISNTEPTLVATLDRPLTPEEADSVAKALRQESIAQKVGDTGELYGPGAEKWRPFNDEYFLMPKAQASRAKMATLEHYSRKEGLREIHPRFHGTGQIGAERTRMENEGKGYLPRSYFYRAGSAPEARFKGLTKYTAQVPEDRLADLATFQGTPTEREQAIKKAGYLGFYNSESSMPEAVALFEPIKVGNRLTFSPSQIQSKAFQKWFANSKVVNKDGSPKVVYHGSKAPNITEFKKEKIGTGIVSNNQMSALRGFWFSSSRYTAEYFADFNDVQPNEAFITQAFLSIQNPLVLERMAPRLLEFERAEYEGRDGIIANDVSDGDSVSTVYVVFEPTQIKSATGNIGTFSSKNPDIRFSPRVWFSQLGNTLAEKMPSKASKEQVRNILKAGNVKEDEIKWTGILDYLDAQKEPISKDALLAWLGQNDVRVNEVVKRQDRRGGIAIGGGTMHDELGEPMPLHEFVRRWGRTLGSLGQDVRRVENTDFPEYQIFVEPTSAINPGHFPVTIHRVDEQGRDLGALEADMTSFGEHTDVHRYRTEQLAIEALYEKLVAEPDREERADFAERLHNEGFDEYDDREQDGATQFEGYTLPGGTDYTELLLTLPPKDLRERQDIVKRLNEISDAKKAGTATPEMAAEEKALNARRMQIQDEIGREVGRFQSQHFDEPNILAHVRFKTRKDGAGKNVLFLEEVQSDWHEQGREKGYYPLTPDERQTYERLKARWDAQTGGVEHYGQATDFTDEELDTFRDLERRALRREGVPDAPFKTTWPHLVMKRMLRYAAERNYDRLAWTTGAQQNERYGLSKQLQLLVAERVPGNSGENYYRLTGIGHDGRQHNFGQMFSADELPNTIGRELADKVISNPQKRQQYEGLDLEVGGSGMKYFYDQMLPKFMEKYLKRFGTRVDAVSVQLDEGQSEVRTVIKSLDNLGFDSANEALGAIAQSRFDYRDRWEIPDAEARVIQRWVDSEFTDAGKRIPTMTNVHSIALTPEMKDSVINKGQPLFSRAKKDLLIAENVSESDAKKLSEWWSRKGHVYKKEAFGRGKQGSGRFSVWLQRVGPSASPARNTPSTYPISQPGPLDTLIRVMQDKTIDVKRFVDAVRESGRVVPESLNPALAEEMYQKRDEQMAKDFTNDELRPLTEKMRLGRVSLEQLDTYLHARHVITDNVNARLAAMNPTLPNNTALSGMTDAEAQRVLATAPPIMATLARDVDDMVNTTRELMVSYGLEKQSRIDLWRQQYHAYVPLHREGFEEEGYPTGTGKSIRGSTVKGRGGSNLVVENILANIAQERDQIITRGEKNRVTTAMAGLLMMHPNAAFAALAKPTIVTVTDPVTQQPMTVMTTGNHQVPTVRRFDPMTGTMRTYPDPMYKSRDNVVNFRVNGDDYAMVFNEQNERAMKVAEAFKNLGTPALSGIMKVVAPYTRYLAAINTQYNPIFGIVNFVRDAQFAMLTLGSTPLNGKQATVLQNAVTSLKGIYQDAREVRLGSNASSPTARLWQRFEHVGGPTGYRDLFMTSIERAEEIERLLNPSTIAALKTAGAKLKERNVTGALQAVGKRIEDTAMFGILSDYNLMMENSIRLGVFKTAVDMGISDLQAASYAKNITVNFNKKGQIGAQMGSLYAFFNANVQGTARIAETLFERTPTGVRISSIGKKIIAGGILVGVLQTFLLAMAGFDDDDPPEFVKQKNFVIPVPGTDKGYVMLPMPLGFNLLPNIGRLAAETVKNGIQGKPMRAMDKAANLIGTLYNTLSPVGGSGGIAAELSPTVADPFIALKTNTDWTGKSIFKEDRSSLEPTPGHTRAHDTATAWAKGLSKAINWATGGTDYVPGIASPTPDAIDYLISAATGGVGREVSKGAQVVQSFYTGEETPTHKIPLAGRFMGSATGSSAIRTRFYENVKRANTSYNEYEGRATHHEPFDVYILTHPEARYAKAAITVQKDLGLLQKQKQMMLEQGASRDAVRLQEKRITSLMDRFNKLVENAQHQE